MTVITSASTPFPTAWLSLLFVLVLYADANVVDADVVWTDAQGLELEPVVEEEEEHETEQSSGTEEQEHNSGGQDMDMDMRDFQADADADARNDYADEQEDNVGQLPPFTPPHASAGGARKRSSGSRRTRSEGSTTGYGATSPAWSPELNTSGRSVASDGAVSEISEMVSELDSKIERLNSGQRRTQVLTLVTTVIVLVLLLALWPQLTSTLFAATSTDMHYVPT